MQKDKGEAMTYVAIMVTVILFFIFFLNANELIVKQNLISDLQSVSHSYLLEMEKEGCLTNQLRGDLTDSLEELGFSNIVFEGTTTTQVAYGEMMVLSFKCKLGEENVSYSKIMTSKYIEEN